MKSNSDKNEYAASNGNPPKIKKKMSPVLKFLLIVFGIVFSFIIIAGMGIVSYIANSTFEEPRLPNNVYDDTQSQSQKSGVFKTVEKIFEKLPERTTFVIMGFDVEGGGIRSDTIIMGSFDRLAKKISLVSVPRDIMISLPKEDIKEYNKEGIYPPSYMKMNEIPAYVGMEYGIGALKKQLENEFGVNLQYFVKIDTKGFREVINALGGVEMTLTRDYYYYDPDQNLLIDLKAGKQVLMGKDAEGFVRFRHDYAGGDLQRIEVQQKFMGELFRQTLSKENLIQNAPELLQVFLDNVTTNMTLSQAMKYLQYLPDLSAENLEMYSLGGENTESYRGPDNLSYIRLDRAYVDEIIETAFFGGGEEPPADSKELKIAVLNGSGVSGLAKETQTMLEQKGYNVLKIGDYTGTRDAKDRIFVKKPGYGQDLKEIFKGSLVIADKTSLASGSDITIVLGTDNKEE